MSLESPRFLSVGKLIKERRQDKALIDDLIPTIHSGQSVRKCCLEVIGAFIMFLLCDNF